MANQIPLILDAITGRIRRLLSSEGVTVDAVQLNTAPTTQPGTVGQMVWDAADGSVMVTMAPNVSVTLGQSTTHLCRNTTGATLLRGTAVYIAGAQAFRTIVAKALATSDATSATVIGILAEDIPNNGNGYVLTEGHIHDVNTSALTEGGLIYLSPLVAGGITDVKPVAPDHMVMMGICVRSHATLGSIFVKVQNGYELAELHDVLTPTPLAGQMIRRRADNLVWENAPGRGQADGVASLGADGKILIAELPAAVAGAMSYQGTWNAATNTPALASGVGTKGYYYVVSVAGSTNLDGHNVWTVDDIAVFNGTTWDIIQGGVGATEMAAAAHSAAEKTSVVDADELFLVDSAASFGPKRLTWANLKLAVKSYYDSVAATLTNKTLAKPALTGKSLIQDPRITAISTAFPSRNFIDICLNLAQNDFDRGRSRKRKGQTTRSEARSTGTAMGSYATAAAAVAAGGVLTDYYYNTTNNRFEEITNVGTPVSTVTYRAGKEDFPTNAAVTTEASRIIVWDLDGATPSMWTVLETGGGAAGYQLSLSGSLTAVKAAGSLMLVACGDSGLHLIDFDGDYGYRFRAAYSGLFQGSTNALSARNGATVFYDSRKYGLIVSNTVRSISTVYPRGTTAQGAIAIVGTPSGGSQIGSDGVVWDATGAIDLVSCDLNPEGMSAYASSSKVYIFNSLLTADTALTSASYILDTAGVTEPHIHGIINKVLWVGNTLLIGTSTGFFQLVYNRATPAASILSVTTSTYTTGPMVGAVVRCYLANSQTVDRSVNGATLTIVGALTEITYPGGRTVYTGWSAVNFAQEATNAAFNARGAGNFYDEAAEVKWPTAATLGTLISYGDGATNGSMRVERLVANTLRLSIYNAGWTTICTSTAAYTDTLPHKVGWGRATINGVADTCFITVDGVIVASGVSTLTISNATGYLRIGEAQDVSAPWTGGQISTVHIGTTAPTVEGMTFVSSVDNAINGGVTCLLSSSSTTTTIDYNKDTGVAHVGNGSNIDEFASLKRITSYAHGLTTLKAIASGDGFEAWGGTTGGTYQAVERSVSAELREHQDADKKPVPKQIPSDSAGKLSFPQGYKATAVTSTAGTYVSLATNAQTKDCFVWFISGLTASTNYDCQLVRE